jgi:iron-sulfur cluster repair protein YtfE (RIC family)
MKPTEVRRRILHDHDGLRTLLCQLEDSASNVLNGKRRLLGRLRGEGEQLLEQLLEHMSWEDRYLAPALRDADAWGEERAARLDHDHREQRELLRHVLEKLHDQSRPPVLLARTMLDLVQLLREDMVDEEKTLLDERVLRDDVVAVDVEAG